LDVFRCCGLRAESTRVYRRWRISPLRRILMHIGTVRVGHFWLSPNGRPGTAWPARR
ncbi:unnamed protein product, partial [marine sediment metagenome]